MTLFSGELRNLRLFSEWNARWGDHNQLHHKVSWNWRSARAFQLGNPGLHVTLA